MKDATMGNQQETVTEAELAWLAGVLDSDGSVQMSLPKTTKAKRHRVVNVWIDISNGDPLIIEKAASIFKRLGINSHIVKKRVKPIRKDRDSYYLVNTKTCLSIRISRLAAVKMVLEALLPYMAGYKAGLARTIIKFCDIRLKKGRKPYEKEDLMVVLEFFKQRNGKYAAKNVELLNGFLNDCTPDTDDSVMIQSELTGNRERESRSASPPCVLQHGQ